jgi:hypothetical protein
MTHNSPLGGRGRPVCDFLADDLRQSTRFPKEPETDFAVVWQVPGSEFLVEVHDESLTGICLVMADAANFPVGAEAEVVYHATILHGVVRHVTPRGDGTFLVGMETQRWAPQAQHPRS